MLQPKKEKAPEIEIEEKEKKPVAEGPEFILKEVNITGSTVFEPEDFLGDYEEFIDKKVRFKDLEAVVERIKLRYKEKGYLTTTTYIPEQEVKDGKVEIRVAEGKMGDLNIEGAWWFPPRLIKKYFHTKKNEILNIFKLQTDLLRLNKNSDAEIKSVLAAGAEAESVDTTLKVKDYFPWHLGASFDNQGTRLIGKDRTLLTVRSTDVSASNDTLFLSFLLSRSASAQGLGYELPVDTYGTKLGVNYSHFNMGLTEEYKYLNITGDSKTLTFYIIKELCLSENYESSLNVGIDIKSVKKHVSGVMSAEDQLRTPYIDLEFMKTDSWGQSTFSPRFDFGTGRFLGASSYDHPMGSRRYTGGFFFKYSQTLNRIQRMFLDSYTVIRSQVQLSSRTLSPSDQLQLGGANSIRGYPEGDFLADSGAVVNIDWIFPMYLLPADIKMPITEVPLRRQIEPLVFFDFGGGRVNKALPGERRDKFLAGIGGGLRVRMIKNLYCRFEWAKDIGSDPQPGGGHSNFHIMIQSEV
jgi:hemolysin activation/secretion protein